MHTARLVAGWIFVTVFLWAFAVSAEMTTTHLDSDSELLEYLSDTLFVSEGRIGDSGGSATFELDLGYSTGSPAETAQYDWQNGVAEPFTIDYDSETGTVTYTLGGETLQYVTPYMNFDALFVRTRAVNSGTSISVTDLVIDGENVNDTSESSGSDGLDILLIYGVNLIDGFTMEGTATLCWTGDPPTQSRLAFQVKVARSALIETESYTWGKIKDLYW
jgi:hypothetical protein